jgi:FixJ family two-component response regulator
MKKSRFPKFSIMIVDNDETIIEILTQMLRLEGITNVIGCQDSRQVYDLCGRLNVGIMLLDLKMPFLSGEEILLQSELIFPGFR